MRFISRGRTGTPIPRIPRAGTMRQTEQRMEHHRYRPPPPLDRFVDVIWTFEGEVRPHQRERLLPDGSVGLVVNLHEERIPVYDSENADRCQIFRGSVVCGPHSQFFVIDTASQSNVAGVHFKPGGAYPFLKLPGGEIHNLHVGLNALWGARAGEVRERLLASKTARMKCRVLEEALLAQAEGPPERHPAVAFALNEFHGAPETQKISEVTDKIGLSPRRFIDVFRREVGLTPKLFCRVRRFQKVLRHISAGRLDWAEIALTCGYFDQAHFIHDFRAFSGINPSSYLADHTPHLNHVPIRG
jgi:AraC-like DNA-binding protein